MSESSLKKRPRQDSESSLDKRPRQDSTMTVNALRAVLEHAELESLQEIKLDLERARMRNEDFRDGNGYYDKLRAALDLCEAQFETIIDQTEIIFHIHAEARNPNFKEACENILEITEDLIDEDAIARLAGRM